MTPTQLALPTRLEPIALEPYHYACKCGKAWATVGIPGRDGVPDALCSKCAAKVRR